MITKEQLQKRLEASLRSAKPANFQVMFQKMIEHLRFMNENYDDLAPDAKELLDKGLEVFQRQAGQAIEELPDSKEKRMLKRLHAGSLGERWLVDEMMKALEAPPEFKEEDSRGFRSIFTARLQNVTDFLLDVYENTFRGPAAFAQITLLGMCVDELLATLHLTQHYYVNQAYSHIRTVVEHIDKVELFRTRPKWAEVWCSEDGQKVRKELSPAQVRKKLGRPKYDPIYGFFSTLGPHGTFQAVQTKTFRRVEPSAKGNPLFQQWLGGCPAKDNLAFLNGYALYAVHHLLLQLVASFGKYLNEDEVEEVVKQSRDDTKRYFDRSFLPWAKKRGLNVAHLGDFLKSGPWGESE
jgi:hypothetical protein